MKKFNLKKAALLGLAGGLMIATSGCQTSAKNPDTTMNQNRLTTDQLLSQLSPDGKKIFSSLDEDGKKLALKLANQDCAGKNGCKGQNSCKTDNNSCKGQGACKGTSPGPFKNKDDAVKVAQMYMAKKRQNILNQ